MKNKFHYFSLICLSIITATCPLQISAKNATAAQELQARYNDSKNTPSDICEHLPLLRKLAADSETVTEIGMRSMVSSWGILLGLSENNSNVKSYLGIDLNSPPLDTLMAARKLARASGIAFSFWQDSDMNIDIPRTDFLFIDSLHTYAHLTYELEKFSDKANKYIALHDTSEPWGNLDDTEYNGDHSEYPAFIDKTKKGLWPAVEDFLQRHPEWTLADRHQNCHGFTILKRVSSN